MSQEDVDFLISRISNFNSRNPIEKRNILSDMKEKMDAIKDFIPAEDKALYDSLIEKLNPPPPPPPSTIPIDVSMINPILTSLNQILL